MSRYNREDKPSVVAGSGGVGLCSLLTVAFVVLKLCNVINWSWFWVLFPTILSAGLWFLLIIIVIIVAFATDR